MQSTLVAVLLGLMGFSTSAFAAVAPIPESEQAELELRTIAAYDGQQSATPVKKLRVLYFTPAERAPVPRYEQRLEAIFEDLRAFYRDEMNRHGFGPKTFALERDSQGKFIVHLVKGRKDSAAYTNAWKDRRRLIGNECEEALANQGIWFSNETVAIVCNLANWNSETHTFTHPSPYSGEWTRTGGLCWLMDSPILNLDYLGLKEPVVRDPQFGQVPLGRRNSMFIGSIGHELGHAFGLLHSGERWDEKPRGKSLMGVGNLQYRLPGEGAFLTMASASRLAARPLFCGSNKGLGELPKLEECNLSISTNVTRPELLGRPGAFRLEGKVKGWPPVYAVIAYFDSLHDGGYESPTATAVPDAEGRFALEISDLEPCKDCKLFVSFCHANGTTSGQSRTFTVPGISGRERANAAAQDALKAFRQLLKAHQVPGFKDRHGQGDAMAHATESSDCVEVAFKMRGEARVYHYTMRREPKTGSWEIQKAWTTDDDNPGVDAPRVD